MFLKRQQQDLVQLAGRDCTLFVGAYQNKSKLPLELPELQSEWYLVVHYTARLHTQGPSVAHFDRTFNDRRVANNSWYLASRAQQLDLQGRCRHTGLTHAGDMEPV